MSASYIYSLATDFTTSHAIGIIRFINDVQTSGIIEPLINIAVNGDPVTVTFVSALSPAEVTTLNTVVANHISGTTEFDTTVTLYEQQSSGTDGGTFTSGAWQTRTLTGMTGTNVNLWISMSSNTFTLVEGTYYVSGVAPSSGVGNNQLRVYDVTNSAAVFYGPNSTTDTAQIFGTINVPTYGPTFSVQHMCQTTQTTTGFGMANGFGGPETYTTIEIRGM